MPVQSMAHGILRLWSMTMRFSWSQTRASWAQAEWARKMFGEGIAMAVQHNTDTAVEASKNAENG